MSRKWVPALLYYGLPLAGAAVCFRFGGDVPYESQTKVYDKLTDVSAISFGVMGAWIAIIYPNALSEIVKNKRLKASSIESTAVFRALVRGTVISTGILVSVLLAAVAAPLLKELDYLSLHRELCRSISFAFVGALSILQAVAIAMGLVPLDYTVGQLNEASNTQRVTSLVQRDSKTNVNGNHGGPPKP